MTNYLVFDNSRKSTPYTALNGSDAQKLAEQDGIEVKMVLQAKPSINISRFLKR